jgi:hypothetical protein
VASQISSTCNGTCIEALISTVLFSSNPASLPSLSPLGISPNISKAQGTFFYSVGFAGDLNSVARRIGFVRLPIIKHIDNPRDDDDTDDGFDRTKDARWHNSAPDDDDADGVPNEYDSPSSTDEMSTVGPTSFAAGQVRSSSIRTTSSTLALVAAAQPTPSTGTMAVDVYNGAGTLVATSGPVVGIATATLPKPGAGTFTIRVRNLSTSAVTATLTTVLQQPLVPQ